MIKTMLFIAYMSAQGQQIEVHPMPSGPLCTLARNELRIMYAERKIKDARLTCNKIWDSY